MAIKGARFFVLLSIAVWPSLTLFSGCAKSGGPSDYDRIAEAKQNLADDIANGGAKVEPRHFSIGSAYAVSLRGMTITDDLLRQVKKLGNICELDLSNSTVTDEQLGLITQIGLTPLLVKFDLSHTSISDAGLDKLDNLRVLKELDATGTKVTAEAANRLKEIHKADPKKYGLSRNPTIKLK